MLNLYSTSLFEMIIPFQVFVIAFLIAMILQRQHDDQEIHIDLESVKQYSKNNAGKRTETFIGIEKSKIDLIFGD